MNDESAGGASQGESARQRARAAAKECRSRLEEVERSFGLLLELRDRKISDLEQRIAGAAPGRSLSGLLVVDDAESMIELSTRFLEGQQLAVAFSPGNRALAHLRSKDYDVVMVEATTRIEADQDGMALCRKPRGRAA